MNNKNHNISKEKICVLLASYNPNRYIIEQIESILNQKEVDVEIIIRDDCSSDKSYLNIVKTMPRVTVLEGEENLGVAKNIRKLLEYAKKERKGYIFFAYSDQDDYWMKEKLITGINKVKEMNKKKPCLYYTNLLVVDENLHNGFNLFRQGIVKNTVSQSLCQIFEFACTSVFNYKMIEEITSRPFEYMGFDHLLYYTAIIKGDVYYDDVPYIKYRQHGNNVSGVKGKGISYFYARAKRMLLKPADTARAGGGSFKDIAKYLSKYFADDLRKEDLVLINDISNYNGFCSRMKIIANRKLRVGYQPKDFFRCLRLLIGRY